MPSHYTLTNTGYLAQSPTVGLYLAAGGTVTNTGTIIGAGIRFSYSGVGGLTEHTYDGTGIIATAPLTLVNTGEVYGIETGVSLQTGWDLLNAGVIEATGAYRYSNNTDLGISHTRYPGTALYNASGALSVTVLPGAEFIGAVTDKPGNGTLVLGGSTAGTIELTSFSGFSSLVIDGGSTWVVDGFTATAASYAADTGIVLSNAFETISLAWLNGTIDNTSTTTGSISLAIPGTVLNEGAIAGLSLGAGGTVVNDGLIHGTPQLIGSSSPGYFWYTELRGAGLTAEAFSTIVNSGTITGFAYGIDLAAGGDIFDSGTIAASGEISKTVSGTLTTTNTIAGPALLNAAGILDLTIAPGAVVSGAVTDKPGNGTLVLGGSTAGTINLTSFSGLPTIEILAGSDWTLESGSGNGFVQGDRIIFEGFSVTSNSYTSGVGLVLSNATAAETLHLSGLDAHELSMVVGSDGTTITAPVSTISTYVSLGTGQHITLGYGGYATSLTITNAGTVSNGGGTLNAIVGSGTITNAGLVADGIGLLTGTVINTGQINGYGSSVYVNNGVVENSGTISAIGFGVYARSGLTLILDQGSSISGTFEAADDAAWNGTLVLNQGVSYLNFNEFKGFTDVSFGSGTHDLAMSLSGLTLSGFGGGDTLQISNNSTFSASYITGAGIVLTNANGSTTLTLTGGPLAGGIEFTPEAGNELDITAACFCAGTRIDTPHGGAPVEKLAIGDVVTTDLGPARIKWIGRRAYDGAFIAGNHLALPVKIRRHALGFNVPSRDVFLSADHGVCEGGVFVPAWRLVNGVSITQAQSVERVEYFHIELEKPAVIFAENMPAESFVDADCRARFQNAAEYDLLYPEPATPQNPCRPRIEDGFLLQRIKQRIDARAGLTPKPSAGPLRGCIDETTPRLRGWAQDTTAPETPVLLEILQDGTLIGTILANRYRPDLRKAGLGSGCHAFDLPAQGNVTLRRASDGARIGAEGLKKARGSAP